MTTMAEISAAINQIDVKKESLQKSFLHLQSQSPSSFNLPFKWADLDSYFTTLRSSLQSTFNLLQTLSSSSDATTVLPRPELKSFCENSDGLGLNRFIARSRDRPSILSELPDAYRCAPDASAMVLDAMVGFYSTDLKDAELRFFRSGSLIMLEGLVRLNPVIPIELKDKAKEMAVQWNQKRASSSDPVEAKEQTALGFLLIVEAYRLIDQFTIDDIMDCFLIVVTYPNTVDLCRRIIPTDKINDLIKKLIDKEMHVTAVKFSIQLQKTDEFPPVDLLEERKLMSVRVIEETLKNVKDLHVYNDVTTKEINALKSIIKCVDENDLQSEYPSNKLVELVNKLENEVENSKQTLVNDLESRKRPAKSKSKTSKKPKLKNVLPTAKSIQQTNSQKSDSTPDPVGQCHDSPVKGSGPAGSNARCGSTFSGSCVPDIDYSFYVPPVHQPSDNNSNGWISD